MKNVFLVVLTTFALCSCGSVTVKTSTTADSVQQTLTPIAKVSPPMTITEQQAKIDWVVANYWNLFDFSDTTYINSVELEQAFVDWIGVLPYATSDTRQKSFIAVFTKANVGSREMLDEYMRLAERYLYDPNSPLRNEDIYIDVLRSEIALAFLPEIEKIRPSAQLDLALKNRVGDKASDFSYTTINGTAGRLSAVRSELLIVFFNNPDCPNCRDVRELLNAAVIVNELEKASRLKILAIYPDQNRKQWENYASNIPDRWINAMSNKKMESGDLYDLRAIPTLYLLDASKRVLLKDASPEQLINYLGTSVKAH